MSIKTILEGNQDKFEWDFDFQVVGVSAFARFHDQWNGSRFIPELKQHCRPNGYLLGVGCDTILSLLALYQSPGPRGIVLVDIDPAVIASAKIVVHCLETCPTSDSFLAMCSTSSIDQLQTLILENENNFTVKEQMRAHLTRQRGEWEANFKELREMSSSYWLNEGYPLLHQLAKTQNIAVLHADLFNPALIECIHKLPDFKNLNNIIYLSNATDHISRQVTGKFAFDDDSLQLSRQPSEYTKEKFVHELNAKIVSRLELLKQQAPYENCFIDTTRATNYNLRLRKHIPYFTPQDF